MERVKLVAATGNRHKLQELARILNALGFDTVSQMELCPGLEVEETGTTFAENARLKAEAVCLATGLPAVADDSGLCVDALGGEPGVYSARYAGTGATDEDRMKKVLQKLEGVPQPRRTARFISAICCVFPNGDVLESEGVCEGGIAFEKAGDGGFGYDPIFQVKEKSFAEMSPEDKDAVSHRGKALRAFEKKMKAYLDGQRTEETGC